MTTHRILLAATAAIALAACDRATTEPRALVPTGASFRRGADDAAPRQAPQPGDDKGGQAQPGDDKGQHAQPLDDKGGKGRGADDAQPHFSRNGTTSGQPQPGDDKGHHGGVQPGDDKGHHAQPLDDKGGKGRGKDDPANHG